MPTGALYLIPKVTSPPMTAFTPLRDTDMGYVPTPASTWHVNHINDQNKISGCQISIYMFLQVASVEL